MNRPFRGSWAQTLKRASPSSFSTGWLESPCACDVSGSTEIVMNSVKSSRSDMDNGKCAVLCFFSSWLLDESRLFSHIYQGFVCFHALTVIIIEFFNLNHQCQTHQHAIYSVYTVNSLDCDRADHSIKPHWILNPRISFLDGCNQDHNYRTSSQSTFFPHQPHSWSWKVGTSAVIYSRTRRWRYCEQRDVHWR